MGSYRNSPHWTRCSDGEWAVCVPGSKVAPGTQITLSKADGSLQSVVITNYIEESSYGSLYEADTSDSDRMYRAAETTILRINKESSSGEFIGSEGEIYETTLNDCTCMDFLTRRLACKHMYRLARELGSSDYSLPDGNADITTVSTELQTAPKKHWVHMLSLIVSIFCLVFGTIFFIDYADISFVAPWFVGFFIFLCISIATKQKNLKTSKLSVFLAFPSSMFMFLSIFESGIVPTIIFFVIFTIFLAPTLVFAFVVSAPISNDSTEDLITVQDSTNNEDVHAE